MRYCEIRGTNTEDDDIPGPVDGAWATTPNNDTLLDEINGTVPDNDTLLEEMSKELIKEYAPIFVFVVIVTGLGIIGNIMTVIFYGFTMKKSTTTVFISSLAAIDLATCVLLSDRIVSLVFIISFRQIEVCKIMNFLNHGFVVASALVLWLISVDRYIKVCRYNAWQFSVKSGKMAVTVVIGVSVLCAVPNLVLLDIVPVNLRDSHNRTVQGYACMHPHGEELKDAVLACNIIDTLCALAVIITFVILYSLIGRKLFISRKKTRVINQEYMKCSKKYFAKEGTDNGTMTCERNRSPANTCQENQNPNLKLEARITIIMFVITIGYIVSFTPYFVVNLMSRSFCDEFGVGIQFSLSSYLLNSAINPYIIGIFNPGFRQFVLRSFCRCCPYIYSSPTTTTTTTITSRSHTSTTIIPASMVLTSS